MLLIFFILLTFKVNALGTKEIGENSLKNKFNKNQKELNEIQFYGDLQSGQIKQPEIPQKEIQNTEHNKELRYEGERLTQRSIQNDGSPQMNKGVNMRDSFREYFGFNSSRQNTNGGTTNGGSGGTGTGGATGGTGTGGGTTTGTSFDKFLNALAGSETESGLGKPGLNTFIKGANNIYTVNPAATKGAPMYSNGIAVANHYQGSVGYIGTWQIGEGALRDSGFYYKDKTPDASIDFAGIQADGKLAWSKSSLSLMGIELTGDKISSANAGASQVLLNNRFISSALTPDKNPLTNINIISFNADYQPDRGIRNIMLGGRTDLTDNTSTAGGYVPTADQYQNALNFQATAIQAIMINSWNRFVVPKAYGEIEAFIGKTIVVNERTQAGYGIPTVGTLSFILTRAGVLAGCHILGCGSVVDFLKLGTLSPDSTTLTVAKDSKTDGNLNVSHYMAMYAGYATPFDPNTKTTILFGKANTVFNPTNQDILPVFTKNADGSYSNGALSQVGSTGTSNTQKIFETVADSITNTGTFTQKTDGTAYTISTNNTYTDYVYAGLANQIITITGGNNFTNISSSAGGGAVLEVANTPAQNFTVAPADKLNVAAITAATNYTALSGKLVMAYYDQTNGSAFKAVAVSGLTTFNPGTEFYILYTDKTPAEIQAGNSVPTSNYTFKLTYTTANVQAAGTLTAFLTDLQNKFVFTAVTDYTLTIDATTALGNQIIYGSDNYKNVIIGGAGNDYLVGGMKNDSIDGKAGFNILEGGKGADTFIIGKEATGTIINDFSITEGDKINLARGFVAADITGATITKQASSVVQIDTVTKAPTVTHYNYDVLVGGKTISITSQNSQLTIDQIKANMAIQ